MRPLEEKAELAEQKMLERETRKTRKRRRRMPVHGAGLKRVGAIWEKRSRKS